MLEEQDATLCGSLIRVEVTGGELKGTVIDRSDPVSEIIDMPGVSSVVFLVNIREHETERPPSALTLLHGGSKLEPIPDWADTSHPAYGVIYGDIKLQLVVDGVQGVQNPSHVYKFFEAFEAAVSTTGLTRRLRNRPFSIKTRHAPGSYAPSAPNRASSTSTPNHQRKQQGFCRTSSWRIRRPTRAAATSTSPAPLSSRETSAPSCD